MAKSSPPGARCYVKRLRLSNMKKYQPFEHEEHNAPSPWRVYAALVLVGLAIAIIVTEVVFGEMITSWMYSE